MNYVTWQYHDKMKYDTVYFHKDLKEYYELKKHNTL
jgi:hypothetical protein